jgi:hypothetical protein
MSNGKFLYFKNGELATADEEEIKELDAEIKRKHPHIYIDEGKKTITSEELLDPMAALKKRIIAEHEATKSSGKDMGVTVPLKNIGTTASLQNVKESLSKA